MKKAKEYSQQILSAENISAQEEAIKQVFSEMMWEIEEIAKERKIKSNSALKAVIMQQVQKWKAICKIVNKETVLLKESGFLEVLQLKIPETKYLL